MPACPEIGFAIVDVRDVALAHRLAMEKPNAAGNRYICAGNHYWMRDIALILADEFGPQGYRVPTGKLPYWVLWLVARFDPDHPHDAQLHRAEGARFEREDSKRARMEFRNVRETVVDMARSMIEQGVVPAEGICGRRAGREEASGIARCCYLALSLRSFSHCWPALLRSLRKRRLSSRKKNLFISSSAERSYASRSRVRTEA
jgi:hypothetical protein